MLELEQLVFARKFPFSPEAKRVVESSGKSLAEVPQEVIDRAAAMIESAWKKKPYRLEMGSRELLEEEVLAFPTAKIILSILNDAVLNERFARMTAENTFFYLQRARNKGREALGLAQGFGLGFTPAEKQGYFALMPLTDFLKASFSLPNLKLVNQPLEKGRIFLNENDFCRFVSEMVFEKILRSLPVDVSGVPEHYKKIARTLKTQLKSTEFREFEARLHAGKISIDNFAPCMKDMYLQLFNGTNLPHMARFDLATFLVAVGMPEDQIDALFAKAPNYKQKLTLYHVRRIARLKLSPPGCKKVREHGYCPLQNCTEKHPMLYYERKLRENKKQAA